MLAHNICTNTRTTPHGWKTIAALITAHWPKSLLGNLWKTSALQRELIDLD